MKTTPFKPRIEYGRPIDIAELPKEQGKDPETVLQRPLEDHPSRLFKRFFESAPNPGREAEAPHTAYVSLPIRSQQAGERNDLLVITVPIVMAPAVRFHDPLTARTQQGKASRSPHRGDQDMARRTQPVRKEGPVCFRRISVYSSLDPAKLPVYRLSNLQLGVKKDRVRR